jgi:hypothetical protein
MTTLLPAENLENAVGAFVEGVSVSGGMERVLLPVEDVVKIWKRVRSAIWLTPLIFNVKSE